MKRPLYCRTGVFISSTMIIVALSGHRAAADSALSLGATTWFTDNGQQHALAAGPDLDVLLSKHAALSFSFLDSSYYSEGDVERHRQFEFLADGRLRYFRLGLGFYYEAILTRLKPGWEWDQTMPDEDRQRNADIYGPVLHLQAAGQFAQSRYGWFFDSSWLIKDFGELDSLGYDASAISAELALTAALSQLKLSAGYKIYAARDLPDRLTNETRFDRNVIQGVILHAAVTF